MTSSSRQTGEKRKMGADLIISRETTKSQGGRYRRHKKLLQVLLIKDKSKPEISAGFRKWSSGGRNVFGFPGGGRGTVENSDGTRRTETTNETLKIELYEELGLLLKLAVFEKGNLQKYPFLVAQIKTILTQDSFCAEEEWRAASWEKSNNMISENLEENLGENHGENPETNCDSLKTGVIHQIAATSLLLPYDELKTDDQNFIDERIKRDRARWINLEDIYLAFKYLSENQKYLKNTQKRQHAYTMAYLWYLDLILSWSDEAILVEINRLNRITKQVVRVTSKKNGYHVKNGTFSRSGNVLLPSELSPEDRAFLYERAKPSKRIN